MRIDIENRKGEIITWISNKDSKAFMCKELKCKPETLNWWLDKMGLNYNGNQGSKGKVSHQHKTALEYIEVEAVRSCVLKKKLIEEGYREDKCEKCKLSEWNDEPIPLELHHVDGDRFNNEFSNLQILCCNCHAQTDNYRKKKTK
jgi:hypothetical protein